VSRFGSSFRSYLSRLKVPRQLQSQGCTDIAVRVIKYQLKDQDGNATETFTLATTLLDPEVAPSNELAELYQSRWEIESAFGAFKSQLKGDGVVLHSKTPDGAQQELWALLCAYHAIRELICAAAEMTKQDPLRISFIAALDTVRGPVGDPAAFPPHKTIDQCIGAALTLIAVHKNRERRGRSNPRHAKRTLRYSNRPADPTRRPLPRGPLTLVMLPLTVIT